MSRDICQICENTGWINSTVCIHCGGLGFMRKSKGGFKPEFYVARNAKIIEMRLANFRYAAIREKFPELSESRLGQIFDNWKFTQRRKKA